MNSQQADMGELLSSGLTTALEAMEQQVDQEISKLDKISKPFQSTNDDFGGDDDEERELFLLREKRKKELMNQGKQNADFKSKGHGSYTELPDQQSFFEASKGSQRLVVHFYRPTTWRCQIVDKHLIELSEHHLETKFAKINAEKSPFLAERLNIQVIPTLVLILNGKVVDKVIGFDEIGGRDDFKTIALATRIKQVIQLKGNVYKDAKQKEEVFDDL